MRVLVVNEKGVRFHGNAQREPPVEEYCSCSRSSRSPRHLELRNDDLFLTVPDKEYVALLLRKTGGGKRPLRQNHPQGVSIYTTDKYMAWVRFARTYQEALRHLHTTPGKGGEKFILSTQSIDKVQEDQPNIFMFESAFGDVFGREDYTGETTSNNASMTASLKRSSYTDLEDSYPLCWA